MKDALLLAGVLVAVYLIEQQSQSFIPVSTPVSTTPLSVSPTVTSNPPAVSTASATQGSVNDNGAGGNGTGFNSDQDFCSEGSDPVLCSNGAI